MVVGTLIGYEFGRDEAGRPLVCRTTSQVGKADEHDEPITMVGDRLGWVVVSMQRDWEAIFDAH